MNDQAFPQAASQWVAYFQGNVSREKDLPWDDEVKVGEPLCLALGRTLQRFNLGESGEGRFLKQWAAKLGDESYCAAIELFVAEEQAHSRWFGILLDKIGVPRLTSHWSDAIFTHVRRLGGLNFELITFLSAEIIGQKLFAEIAEGDVPPLVAAVFRRVVKDESAHIAFHVATLRAAFAGQSLGGRMAWRLNWQLLLCGATLLVCYDHTPLFRELGLSRRHFWKECWSTFRVVSARIWRPAPNVAGAALVWE